MRLQVLRYLADARRHGLRTASTKIQSRVNVKGELIWRIGLGKWRPSIEEAIDACGLEDYAREVYGEALEAQKSK